MEISEEKLPVKKTSEGNLTAAVNLLLLSKKKLFFQVNLEIRFDRLKVVEEAANK